MRIDAIQLLPGDVAEKASVIVGVSFGSQLQDFFRGVRDKHFLASDTHALAAVTRINLHNMCLQSRGVAIEALALRVCFGKLLRIGDFFHNYWNVLVSHRHIPMP